MASPSTELQGLLYSTLKADLGVMALVDGVYDNVPTTAFGTKKAYISFGPHDVVDDGADCIESGEHTFQLDCWSRAVGQVACKDIVDAVKVALHERELTLTNNALVEIRVIMRRVFRDPDGLTSHGVVMVQAIVEEA
ncbi:DUF3168 domain-containing protein [Mesorhizobium sp. BR1-1-3]|uniref:DUF3168 domain-containing protein n=1 Tax=Mesorhizobium sp. BR1-1-3 TaxID=2876651 RepID=UPI001CD0E23C|nr:DUF3168 domain-containing protein [Mesorhizobium sp. BR1-1-3]MBZ9888125.1 DUF3168 domain-containing protein [Mesorhizobium sp. BR1-1-3]